MFFCAQARQFNALHCRLSVGFDKHHSASQPFSQFATLCAMKRSIVAVVLFLFAARVRGAETTLAATPPMGWNSWNHFADKVNDSVVRAAADSLVSSGLRDAGYIYVNIDDTWEGQRDAQGVIHT